MRAPSGLLLPPLPADPAEHGADPDHDASPDQAKIIDELVDFLAFVHRE
jgi:hypothetical protein